MRMEDYIRHEPKQAQSREVILQDLHVLRELVDDYYSYTEPHSKVESDIFLTIQEQIDVIIDDVKGE